VTSASKVRPASTPTGARAANEVDLVEAINASDPEVAAAHRFPGSPTIRVDGIDIDPSFVDPGDYTPRCRLFRTAEGLRGVRSREWIENALTGAQSRRSR
jgi:hypothetical protein